MLYQEIAGLVLPGLLPSLSGWFENSMEDGKITMPEWKLLLATMIKTGMYAACLYYGVSGFTETDLSATSSGFAGALIQVVMHRWKKGQ